MAKNKKIDIDTRMAQLESRQHFISTLKTVCCCALVAAFLILMGLVSTGDFQADTNYLPTAAEQHQHTVLAVIATVTAVICGLLLLFCNRINYEIDRMLDHYAKAKARRKKRELEAQQAADELGQHFVIDAKKLVQHF